MSNRKRHVVAWMVSIFGVGIALAAVLLNASPGWMFDAFLLAFNGLLLGFLIYDSGCPYGNPDGTGTHTGNVGDKRCKCGALRLGLY